MRRSLLMAFVIVSALSAVLLAMPLSASAAGCDNNKANGNPFYCACNSNNKSTNAAVDKGAIACRGQNGADPVTGPNGILAKARTIIAVVGGFAAVLIIVISGFKFVTANGDASQVANARNTLLYALIGIAVIAVASGIITFVLRGAR